MEAAAQLSHGGVQWVGRRIVLLEQLFCGHHSWSLIMMQWCIAHVYQQSGEPQSSDDVIILKTIATHQTFKKSDDITFPAETLSSVFFGVRGGGVPSLIRELFSVIWRWQQLLLDAGLVHGKELSHNIFRINFKEFHIVSGQRAPCALLFLVFLGQGMLNHRIHFTPN